MPDTNRPPLSLAAQAVLDAANGANSYGPDDCLNESRWIAAAALRAAVASMGLKTPGGGVILDGAALLAIAAELEGSNA